MADAENEAAWRSRAGLLEVYLRWAQEPLAGHPNLSSRADTFVSCAVSLLALGRQEEGRRVACRAMEAARLALSSRAPALERTASLTEQLEQARTLESLCLAGWLAGGPWRAELLREAARLSLAARAGREAHDLVRLLHRCVGAGAPEEAVALHERCVCARRAPRLPPRDKRFAAGQAPALYIVAHHLAGTPHLGPWAETACAFWINRTRQWKMLSMDFQDSQRLYWARLWSEHFGGPGEIAALMRGIRGW
jgi:hypothetical protein